MELRKELEEIVKKHEEVCAHLIGGFEYKELTKELRELLNKTESK